MNQFAWFAGDITARFKAGDTIYDDDGPPQTAYTIDTGANNLDYPDGGPDSTRVRFTVSVTGLFVNGHKYNVLIL